MSDIGVVQWAASDQTANTPKGTSEPTGEWSPRADVELLVERMLP